MPIVLASGNSKKLAELQQILQGKDVELLPQTNFAIPEAVEDGLSFVENAIIKARHASRLTGLAAISDDSGLEVDALHGAPGIFSARFASMSGSAASVSGRSDSDSRDSGNRDSGNSGSGNSADAANNKLLLELLRDVPEAKRSARFQCAIVLMRFPEDPMPLVCQGSWEGFIVQQETGANGFGYDPLFYVPTHRCTSAQLSPEIKNSISHRAQALQQLLLRWPF